MKVVKRLIYLTGFTIILLGVIYLIMNGIQENKPLDELARKQAPGKFISLSDGVTHYLKLGAEGGTPLLFIHGGGITGLEVWQKNAMLFAEQGFNVLLYDLYGRGYSDRLTTEYTPELFQRQLTELLDSLHMNGPLPFHVISMSMGSLIALDLATANPRLVDRLIMIDPAITGDYRANSLLTIPVVSDLLMTLYWQPKSIENQRKEFFNPHAFESYSKRLKYFSDFKGYKHVNFSTWMHTLNQSKLAKLAQRPAGKVQLIYGNRDPYFPIGNVQVFQDAYPSLKVVEIYDAGHMPHLERADEVNMIMLDFLLN